MVCLTKWRSLEVSVTYSGDAGQNGDSSAGIGRIEPGPKPLLQCCLHAPSYSSLSDSVLATSLEEYRACCSLQSVSPNPLSPQLPISTLPSAAASLTVPHCL